MPVKHYPKPLKLLRFTQISSASNFVKFCLKDNVTIFISVALAIIASHISIWRFSITATVISTFGVHHLAIFGRARIASIIH